MTTYEIVYSNIPHFQGIKMPFNFQDYQIHDWVDLFGSPVQITQKGDTVIALASKTQIFVFQELAEVG